ncbi:hypothetical protein ES703_84085 [subsurface metagenome]
MTLNKSTTVIPASSAKENIKAMTVKFAAPIANPFVIALAVLPAESNLSAVLITSSPNSPCSAIALALSTIGPYASFVTIVPTIANIPTAAIATPNTPANQNEIVIASITPIAGGTTLRSPYEKPERITTA